MVINPDYNSKSGVSIRTIGYSSSRGELLSIITVEEDGTVFGINDWESNDKDKGIYREGSKDHEQA
jgi:hypothetical protein